MGLICPEYNLIKSQLSEYYKTKPGENFMIFKNSNLIIFQSLFQAKLYKEYNDDIFVDESFNNYLKKLFYKKPSFYELIYHLKREESLSYNNYKRKIEGESELIDKKCDKNDLWYNVY
ncbi:hypothetical protein H8356DRAFT_1359033 [Neocallimastix lanati (nom. inval.)]|nr:hypothetical protein H8356DRAFT_1359033 [Neocallimastix sp. JGI-2020a]